MSGSILSFWWDGTTYPVKADSDFNLGSGQEVEGIANSGDTLYKSVKKVRIVEGIDLICTALEAETIEADIEIKKVASWGFKTEEGDVFNAVGRLNSGGYTSQENTLGITAISQKGLDLTPA